MLGVEATLKAARGMFAFAYFDGASRTLWLARDRFGEKPLYYAVWDEVWPSRANSKLFRSIPTLPTDLDLAAVELLMRHSYIGVRTIYRVARKVLPGAVLRIAVSDHMTLETITSITYWDPVEESQRARADPFEGNLAEVVGRARRIARPKCGCGQCRGRSDRGIFVGWHRFDIGG